MFPETNEFFYVDVNLFEIGKLPIIYHHLFIVNIYYLRMIWRNIGGGEEAPSRSNFTVPPVHVRTIGYCDNISSSEFQFSWLLGCKVIHCLDEALIKKIYVSTNMNLYTQLIRERE